VEISHDDAMRLFEYDHSLPLDIREEGVTTDGGATIRAFNYRNMSGKRSQAFLVLPHGTGPFGAVVFLPGGLSGRGEFLSEAVEFSKHGIASLLIDYPELYPIPMSDQEAVTEIIFEMREFRRLMDWLASRPEVDPDRLGLVGVSYGAVRAATFAGVEGGRLKIAVLMSTPASYNYPAMAPFDPIAWVPYVSPCSLYIQEGTQDTWFTHAEAESLIAAARAPKRLVWYEGDHGLNAQATTDYRAWLLAALGSP
jgi:dienelactone hydrolase